MKGIDFTQYQLAQKDVPMAYGVAFVALFLITKSPTTVMKYAGYYVMLKHLIADTRSKLPDYNIPYLP